MTSELDQQPVKKRAYSNLREQQRSIKSRIARAEHRLAFLSSNYPGVADYLSSGLFTKLTPSEIAFVQCFQSYGLKLSVATRDMAFPVKGESVLSPTGAIAAAAFLTVRLATLKTALQSLTSGD